MYAHTHLQCNLIQLQSQISSLLGIFPFTWHNSVKKYRKNRHNYCRFVYTSLICVFQYLFVLLQIIRLKYIERVKLSNTPLLVPYCVALSLLMADIALFFVKHNQFVQFLNVAKANSERIAAKYHKHGNHSVIKNAQKFWDRSTLSNIVTTILMVFLCWVHCITFPDSPCYLTSLLKFSFANYIPFALKLVLYLIGVIIHLIVLLKLLFTFCFFNNLTTEIVVQYMPLIKTELNCSQVKHITRDTMRSYPKLIQEYRRFEIILKMYLNVLGPLIGPGHVLTSVSALICNVNLITQSDRMNVTTFLIFFVATIMFQVSWVIILHASCLFVVFSQQTIRSWKTNTNWGTKENTKLMRKFAKSCKLPKICYEDYISYGRKSVLNYLKALYRKTFRVVCALKSK